MPAIKNTARFFICYFVLIITSFSKPASAAESCIGSPDILLTNGTILTMDASDSTASSLRIRGDRIIAVGGMESADEACVDVIDLAGRTVIPGLIDSHTHFVRTAQAPGPFVTGLESATDIASLQGALAEAAGRAEPDEWIASIGGITPLQFAEKRFPTYAELTSAVPDHPVWIQAGYLREGMVNAAARRVLESEGIPVSADGIVSNDGTGLRYVLRTRTDARMRNRFFEYMDYATGLGLTTVVDQGCCDFLGAHLDIDDRPNLTVLDAIWRDGLLPLRIRLQYDHRDILSQDDLRSVSARVLNATYGMGDGWYKTVGVGERVIADEANDDEVFEAYLNVARAGWPLSQHTIREDEIERYLAIMERVAERIPLADLRWSLEHIFEITPDQIARLKAIGVNVRVQDHDYLRNGSVAWNPGPPFRTLLESGIRMGAGTDSGVVGPLNPWLSIYYMVTGKNAGGEVIIPGEQIGRIDALRLYTASNAWFLGEEDDLGSLETGRLADLVVLDKDFLDIDAEAIKTMQPVLTLVGGRIAHASGPYAGLADAD